MVAIWPWVHCQWCEPCGSELDMGTSLCLWFAQFHSEHLPYCLWCLFSYIWAHVHCLWCLFSYTWACILYLAGASLFACVDIDVNLMIWELIWSCLPMMWPFQYELLSNANDDVFLKLSTCLVPMMRFFYIYWAHALCQWCFGLLYWAHALCHWWTLIFCLSFHGLKAEEKMKPMACS